MVLAAREKDPDYLLVDISIADGAFAGRTFVYENLDMPTALAAQLRGFPRDPGDRREVVLGSFGPLAAGGAVRLTFRCLDRAGHAILEAELEDEPSDEEAPRTVVLRMRVEPPAIDDFVAQLQKWAPLEGGSATLRGAA